MFGIVIILFIPAFLCLLLLTYLNNKSNAKKAYSKLIKKISEDEIRWENITQQIIIYKKYHLFEDFKMFEVDVFLISKENEIITIFPLNSNVKHKNMSLLQYEKLLSKFKDDKLFYSYAIDVFSIYYLFDKTLKNNILWMYRRSKSLFI